MAGYINPDELNDFVDRATRVQQTVQKLTSDATDETALREADMLMEELSETKRAEERQKKERNDKEKREQQKQMEIEQKGYTKDSGWGIDKYEYYCDRCKFEIYDMAKARAVNGKVGNEGAEQCPQCNGPLQTCQERNRILQERVDALKEEHKRKQRRKQLWEEYYAKKKRSGDKSQASKVTDYKEWEMWEPDLDTNEYMDDDYIPDIPEFKAMALDMRDRAKKRSAK
ncbi:hypothetical protein RFI_27870 [Reticulomyxa filosa]|uniref:Uncharacterized protein n=1 Tax=Reticulomyxa filosa TaxID=46433 RepID=X6M688_RETFI|nr:hypothetical protein RFI_27870 [Reticulomyxa filosa]|eukprot:ETO09508.1 hypothetical protein RFI_27870 [Reticulomyxa filosa]